MKERKKKEKNILIIFYFIFLFSYSSSSFLFLFNLRPQPSLFFLLFSFLFSFFFFFLFSSPLHGRRPYSSSRPAAANRSQPPILSFHFLLLSAAPPRSKTAPLPVQICGAVALPPLPNRLSRFCFCRSHGFATVSAVSISVREASRTPQSRTASPTQVTPHRTNSATLPGYSRPRVTAVERPNRSAFVDTRCPIYESRTGSRAEVFCTMSFV